MSKKQKNGWNKWKVILGTIAIGVTLFFILVDRGIISGPWLSSEAYAAHVSDYNNFKDEIKDDLADQKLLLYEVKTKVEMIQASLVRVEDKLGTERRRGRNDTSRTDE